MVDRYIENIDQMLNRIDIEYLDVEIFDIQYIEWNRKRGVDIFDISLYNQVSQYSQ